MKHKMIYRVLALVFGAIFIILTTALEVLNYDSSQAAVSNQLIFGFAFIVASVNVFGILFAFLLTSKKDE